jgi:hypothetical protein
VINDLWENWPRLKMLSHFLASFGALIGFESAVWNFVGMNHPIRNRQVMGSTPIVGSRCKSFIGNSMQSEPQNVMSGLRVILSHF